MLFYHAEGEILLWRKILSFFCTRLAFLRGLHVDREEENLWDVPVGSLIYVFMFTEYEKHVRALI